MLQVSDARRVFHYPPPVNDICAVIRDNNSWDASVFSSVFDEGIYTFDCPHVPSTILDLGANAGFATLFLARRYPGARVVCVEPVPANLRQLRRHLALNEVRAEIFPAAVAVEDGPVQMQIARQGRSRKVASISFGYDATDEEITVEGVSVPTVMNRLGWSRVGLVRMGIEGYEPVLLAHRPDWLERVDTLAIECHPGYGEAELQALSQDYGFLPPISFRGIWVLHRAHALTS
jgi:FkbM family methyltransferase